VTTASTTFYFFQIARTVLEEEIFIRDSTDGITSIDSIANDDNHDSSNINSFSYDTPSLEDGVTYNVTLAAVNHLGVPGKLDRFR